MKTKKPTKPLSIRRLAALSGRDPRTVAKDLAGMKADAAADALGALAGAESERSQIRAGRLRAVLADAGMREHRLELAKREAVPASEMRIIFTRFVLTAKGRILAASGTASQTAGLKLGLTGEQMTIIREAYDSHVHDALWSLSRNEWFGLACPACQHVIDASEIKPLAK